MKEAITSLDKSLVLNRMLLPATVFFGFPPSLAVRSRNSPDQYV